ncbi:hypothetical protein BT96DRAFT_999869 [Gymnopus androsaceus JB14]|uniref:Uncharacterized protein n=1 Tax=Gymnopus androsaceus JB14 TaxID=1447944 RepID=A0A6A4H730_9AGAR|nr:hypothetical protein BT96DRAFT_999869 [Gymnopus androsaceus JB14]
MPALTWTDPVVTEPVDALQVATASTEISKSTQDALDNTHQNLRVITVQRPSTSQVIRYLDSLDVGFNPEADSSSPRVSMQDILRHANVNASQNVSGGSIETGPPFAEHGNTPSSSSLPATASAPAVNTSVPLPLTCAAPPGSAGSSASVAVVSSPKDDIVIGVSSAAGSSGVVTVAGEAVIAAGPSTSATVESVSGLGASRKKRSVMGAEERKLLKQSGVDKQDKLMDTINDATTAYEAKLEEIANANGYKVDRIKQLALYSPPIKSRCEVSDWNIMVYFKGKELNDDKGPGNRKTLNKICEELHKDKDLMAAMNDSEEMKIYCEEYYEAKEAESKGKVQRVSGKSMAQVALKTLDLLQAQCDYAFLTVGTNSFGITTCGSFKKDTAKGFFGECFNAYVCTKEALGKKKLSKADMAKAMVKLINRGLEEITGVKDLVMAYSKYEESIVAVYKVVIDGWPEDILRVLPQSLMKVEDVKELYDAWLEGQACWQKLTSKQVRELKAQWEPVAGRVKQAKKQTNTCKQKHAHMEDDNKDDGDAQTSEDEERARGGKRKASGDTAKAQKCLHLGDDKDGGKTSKAKAKSGAKGKGKVVSKEKAKGKGKEGVSTGKSRGSMVCKAKENVVSIPDGIVDDKEGESDEYAEDE